MPHTARTLVLGVAGALLAAASASARPTYVAPWKGLYPGSASLDNVLNGTGAACQLCHSSAGGGNGWNGYGWKIREGIQGGMNITNALLGAEADDGDLDPTLTSNLEEIGADTQPGWTEGFENTIYFMNGNTLPDQPPPSGILGSLDPRVGDSYCGPAVANSTGEPAVIVAKGSDVVAANDLTLVATQLPANQFGYFLNSQTQGFVANPPGAQGNLCLGGLIGRHNKQAASSGPDGRLVLVLDLTSLPTPSGPVAALAGETWNFQAWYRDKNPTITSNFTDGVSVMFQ